MNKSFGLTVHEDVQTPEFTDWFQWTQWVGQQDPAEQHETDYELNTAQMMDWEELPYDPSDVLPSFAPTTPSLQVTEPLLFDPTEVTPNNSDAIQASLAGLDEFQLMNISDAIGAFMGSEQLQVKISTSTPESNPRTSLLDQWASESSAESILMPGCEPIKNILPKVSIFAAPQQGLRVEEFVDLSEVLGQPEPEDSGSKASQGRRMLTTASDCLKLKRKKPEPPTHSTESESMDYHGEQQAEDSQDDEDQFEKNNDGVFRF